MPAMSSSSLAKYLLIPLALVLITAELPAPGPGGPVLAVPVVALVPAWVLVRAVLVAHPVVQVAHVCSKV